MFVDKAVEKIIYKHFFDLSKNVNNYIYENFKSFKNIVYLSLYYITFSKKQTNIYKINHNNNK